MIKPSYYEGDDGLDLFDRFEYGLMSDDETRGFYIGNIIKYVVRYKDKNGIEDLKKAETYLNRLVIFEKTISMRKNGVAIDTDLINSEEHRTNWDKVLEALKN